MIEKLKQLWKDEEGASAVEYGVLVAGIILVSILVIYSIGTQVGESFEAVDQNMKAPPTPIAPATGG
ncbi:Flp family type IVb pilin [Geoalkalibacter halelectricus]|uniref:Flp family type IVb pilin n=1 Tax=Geoalkalibacter halelectricus TaxID=2847045 RepID=UPI003D24C695